MVAAILPVMVGTAGHIDHGKSSLVRALTGIDPDRLKEEKERGMTIDLGFAPLRLRDGRVLGMIDVPGHERFVRNMVAGSTSLDLAILVVAADDGVMPQTREHLDILDLLGVERGIVALTKIDAVDAELVAIATEDVRSLLRGSCLEHAEIFPLSTVTREGVAEFQQQLELLAAAVPARSAEGSFRMPIQRVFTLKGIGTVVTGVPITGRVTPGQDLVFLPGEQHARVRAIQAFGGEVAEAVAGHSTALSVPDAREAGLRRGMVAAVPGIFHSGDAVDVELRVLARARALVHRHPVRFHSGTAELQGTLLLLDRDRAEPGAELLARIVLDEPAACAPNDRFLLRTQTPPVTVGGGRVLRLSESPARYRRAIVGDELQRLHAAAGDVTARLQEELKLAGPAGRSSADLAQMLAIDEPAARAAILALADAHWHERGQRAFTKSAIEEGERELLGAVARMLRDRPLAASIQRAAVRATRTLPPQLLAAVLELMQGEGRVRTGTHGRVLFLDRLQPLPAPAQAQLDRIVSFCERAGFRPPTEAELAGAAGIAAAELPGLLARAVDEGRIEVVGEHVYASRTIQQAMLLIRRNCLQHDGALDIPSLRDGLETSRKYLIPLLEHVDGLGLTILRGGVRRLLPTSAVAQELAAIDPA